MNATAPGRSDSFEVVFRLSVTRDGRSFITEEPPIALSCAPTKPSAAAGAYAFTLGSGTHSVDLTTGDSVVVDTGELSDPEVVTLTVTPADAADDSSS